MVTELNCTVLVDGTDISDKVSVIEIDKDICRIAATCHLELDPDAYSSVEPWDKLDIWEEGKKTFTGFVDEVTKERMPAACIIVGTDMLKRANLYFITDEFISDGQSLEFWVNFFLNLAGLGDAVIYGSTGKTIPKGYVFQYQFAGDYLRTIAAYAGWVIFVDGVGQVHFKEPNYSAPKHEISSSAMTKSELERERDRMWIRNKIRVWGYRGITSEVTRNNPYLPGEQITAAIASSEWDTQGKADAIANEMADEYNDPLDTKLAVIPGDSSYKVGDTVNLSDIFTSLGIGRSYRALVTSIVSRMSEDGYIMRIGLDTKCPRIWGWGRYFPSMSRIWLSLDGGGVYRYDYSTYSWVETNEGLTGDALSVREIEADPLEDNIAWIATYDGIYKFIYGFWEKQTLSDPVNNAGDSPAPTYTDLDFVSIEVMHSNYVVTTAKHKTLNRGWMYVYNGSSWTSYQLEV